MPEASTTRKPAAQKETPGDLIVDLKQWSATELLLSGLGIIYAPGEEDADLGLVKVADIRDVEGTLIDLVDLQFELARRYSAANDGEKLLIDTNRMVESLVGSGNKIMAGSDVPTIPKVAAPAHVQHSGVGRGVRIGMVDTPITESARDCLGVQTGNTFADGGTAPIPYRAGHGTFVASLIKRQAPAAELHLEGLEELKTGGVDSWLAARAMLRLVNDHDIHILNLSIGCYAMTGAPFVIRRAIEKLSSRVLVVAAAGNHGGLEVWFRGKTRESKFWPAAIQPVIAVGGTDGATGMTAKWSPNLPWVCCTAPGEEIVADYLTGTVEFPGFQTVFDGTAQWSGTSFATATVTGAIAARMVSEQAAAQGLPPQLTPLEAFIQLRDEGTLVRKFEPGG